MRSPTPFVRSGRLLLGLLCFSMGLSAFGLTVDELRGAPHMTPYKFAGLFSKFQFQFRAEVQSPEVFLATQSGDCDDYATLAADILKRHGYTPQLVAVRMDGIVHVVCYIEETKSYLDYNLRRNWIRRTVSSGGSLPEIASKVARSFQQSWLSVSEFTYEDGLKRMVKTEFNQESSPAVASSLRAANSSRNREAAAAAPPSR